MLTDGSIDKNVILFEDDISSSVHIGNKRKDILILGIGLTQGLDDPKLSTEAEYSINFSNRIFSN